MAYKDIPKEEFTTLLDELSALQAEASNQGPNLQVIRGLAQTAFIDGTLATVVLATAPPAEHPESLALYFLRGGTMDAAGAILGASITGVETFWAARDRARGIINHVDIFPRYERVNESLFALALRRHRSVFEAAIAGFAPSSKRGPGIRVRSEELGAIAAFAREPDARPVELVQSRVSRNPERSVTITPVTTEAASR